MTLPRVCTAIGVGILLLAAAPVRALTTSYYWGLSEIGGVRSDFIFLECNDGGSFPSEFPELCGGPNTGLLTVAFAHDEPIWDNDASGCDPAVSQEGCDVTTFERILGITLSEVAVFDESEITRFLGVDWLGTHPSPNPEGGAPFITFAAIDALTGIELIGRDDEFFDLVMELTFPDGRSVEDNFTRFWLRGVTVPEPDSHELLTLGLLVLCLAMRSRRELAPRLPHFEQRSLLGSCD